MLSSQAANTKRERERERYVQVRAFWSPRSQHAGHAFVPYSFLKRIDDGRIFPFLSLLLRVSLNSPTGQLGTLYAQAYHRALSLLFFSAMLTC